LAHFLATLFADGSGFLAPASSRENHEIITAKGAGSDFLSLQPGNAEFGVLREDFRHTWHPLSPCPFVIKDGDFQGIGFRPEKFDESEE